MAHHAAHAAADALVNLVEDQRGRGVGVGQRAFERKHEARRLTAGCHLGHRLEGLAGVGADEEFHLVDARCVKCDTTAVGQKRAVAARSLLHRQGKARTLHP